MRNLFIDTETSVSDYIINGYRTKRLVCLAYAFDDEEVTILHATYDREKIIALLAESFQAEDVNVIAHNAIFDVSVLAANGFLAMFDGFLASNEHRVICTIINEKLIRNQNGPSKADRYDLDSVSSYYRGYGSALDKSKDSWRLKYEELLHVPLGLWEPAAINYVIADVEALRDVFNGQLDELELPMMGQEGRHCFSFGVCSQFGLEIDVPVYEAFRDWVQDSLKIHLQNMDMLGIAVKNRDGTFKFTEKGQPSLNKTKLQALVSAAYAFKDEPPPLTDHATKPQVSVKLSSVVGSGNPGLLRYAEGLAFNKLRTSYVEWLIVAVNAGLPMVGSYDLMLVTGRVSMKNRNLTQAPKAEGFRECHKARDGYVLCSIDFDAIELVALAQVLLSEFGRSDLADIINSGRCPHIALAARLLGMSEEEAIAARKDKTHPRHADVVKTRNGAAKAANFGFAGGMGIDRFIADQRSKGLVFTRQEARRLKDVWVDFVKTYEFFAQAGEASAGGNGEIIHRVSGRKRAGLGYSDYCNIKFQGYVADFAKEAFTRCAEACLLAEPDSLLFGARPLLFIHDEILFEIPLGPNMGAAGELLADMMVTAAKSYVPDVKVGAAPAFMTRWSKKAETAKNPDGTYVIFDPEITFQVNLEEFMDEDDN